MIGVDSPTATPDVDVRIVEGVAHVDDLDEFLATVDEIRAETGAVVQLFDARYVVSREHLTRAVGLAERAAARDEAVARDRAVEVLLYAAGRRQIDRALEMGVSEGKVPTVAVAYAAGSDADATGDAVADVDAADVDAADVDAADVDAADVDAADVDVADVDAADVDAADVDVADVDAAVDRLRDLLEPADTLGEVDRERVMDFFDVTDAELTATTGTLTDVVLERVALLDVEK
ncbi:KEOPS complex subunit Cgi121 [Haloparvum sp. PAK95]|uniref:KEOPS complex subunit Cgi121 n=1 Tax=Haloparvum sp. PAK95 TaxID=3418962 RepID=UPI003D2EF2EE